MKYAIQVLEAKTVIYKRGIFFNKEMLENAKTPEETRVATNQINTFKELLKDHSEAIIKLKKESLTKSDYKVIGVMITKLDRQHFPGDFLKNKMFSLREKLKRIM